MTRDGDLDEIGKDLLDHLDVTVDRIVLRLMGLPGYDRRTVSEQRPDTDAVCRELLRLTFIEQLPALETGLRISSEVGRTRAQSGIPLSSVIVAMEIGHEEFLVALSASAERMHLSTDLLMRAAVAVFHMIRSLTMTMRSVFDDVLGEEVRADRVRRARAFRDLVSGRLQGDTDALSRTFGLGSHRTYWVVRARGASDEIVRLEGRINDAVLVGGGLVATIDGDPCALVARLPDIDDGGGVVGVGPRTELTDIGRSFAIATRVAEGAAAIGMRGLVTSEQLGLKLWVYSEHELGDFAKERYLGTLRSMGRAGEILRETLRAYLEHSMSESETARALHLHRNSVRYRLDRYRAVSGIDLRKPEHIVGLWWALCRDEVDRRGGPLLHRHRHPDDRDRRGDRARSPRAS